MARQQRSQKTDQGLTEVAAHDFLPPIDYLLLWCDRKVNFLSLRHTSISPSQHLAISDTA